MSMERMKVFTTLILVFLFTSCGNEDSYEFTLEDDLSPAAEVVSPISMEGSCVTSSYGKRSFGFHNGIDLRTKHRGTSSVFATANGVVVNSAGNNSGHSGEYIKIYHESSGVYSVYAHLSSKYVKPGDVVHKGEIIGVTGDTGRTFGEHLHFGIKNSSDIFIDPESWLRDRGIEVNICEK